MRLFKQGPGQQPRLGIMRVQTRSLLEGDDRVVGLARLQKSPESHARVLLALRRIGSWLQLCGGAKELLGLGLLSVGQSQAEVKIRFKNIWIGGDRLTVCGNGIVTPRECMIDKSKVIPGRIVFRMRFDQFV